MVRKCFAAVAVIALVALIGFEPWLSAQPGKKKGTQYAFLIACSGYDKKELPTLPQTVDDVFDFKAVLKESGFEEDNIIVMHDDFKRLSDKRFLSTGPNIRDQFSKFLHGMSQDDTLVVAYSLHGLHYTGEATGYICPVDAKLEDKKTLIATDGPGGLFEMLEGCKAGRKLLLANACRNGPINVGLAARKIDLDDEDKDKIPKGIAALYSCEAGQKSYYDPDRKRSLFFIHLCEAWRGKYHTGTDPLNLEDLFAQIRQKTKADAFKTLDAVQVPVVRRKYEGEWTFKVSGSKDLAKVEVEEEFTWKGEKRKRTVRTVVLGGEKVEFVKVPAGSFVMGSPDSDKDAGKKEKPQHTVKFTKPLWVAKYPVTKGQFAAFTKAAKYETEAEGDGKGGWGYSTKFEQSKDYSWKNTGWTQTDNHPVVNVTWNDAEAYCKWAAKESKTGIRLLNESEYEYANRGGSKTVYITGDDIASLEGYANVSDKSAKAKFDYLAAAPFDDGYVFSSPVGKFKPNGFGLFDMTGNVWSWCGDWYDAKLYERGSVTDPKAHAGSEQKYRVLRGGSWFIDPRFCRAAYRGGLAPDYRYYGGGFRVCVALD